MPMLKEKKEDLSCNLCELGIDEIERENSNTQNGAVVTHCYITDLDI